MVAVKREKRSEVPREWVEIGRGTPGVTILGEANPTRIQVKASPDGSNTCVGSSPCTSN